MTRPVASWLAWLTGLLLVVVTVMALPASWMSGAEAVGPPLAVAIVVAVTTRRHSAATRLAWLGIALALVLLGAGRTDGTSVPLLSGMAGVSGYLLLLVACARLVRTDGDDPGDLLDGLVLASAVVSVVWTVGTGTIIDGTVLDPFSVSLALANPIAGLALLGLLVGAVLHRRHGVGILAAAALCILASDLAQTWSVVAATNTVGVATVAWLAGCALVGVGARRSAAVPIVVDSASAERSRGLTSSRLVLLAAAALVPLLMAVVQEIRHEALQPLAVGLSAAALFMTVITRLALMVRRQHVLLEERHRLEVTLLRQACEDPLTGLPNRRGFAEGLLDALTAQPTDVAVLILDLDDFKAVNDSLGHPAGDQLLRIIGRRLRAAVRPEDMVARMGGDEFAVTMVGCSTAQQATDLAARILASLAMPVLIEARQLSVTGSIGVARADRRDASPESLLRDADLALYHAKRQGRHRWELFDAELHAVAVRNLTIVSELARAVAEHEFELQYQPIVSLENGRIESFEALVRWRHPELGLLMPAEFLEAAEQSGHVVAIGRWVLGEACRMASAWQAQGHRDVGVNVNVSAGQLATDDILEDVRNAIDAARFAAGQVTLEIIEASLDRAEGALSRLTTLRSWGVRLSIDDFGTGFSSLSRVSELPITELKLDRSLVVGQSDSNMLAAVVRLGQTLGLRLVAEGVETKGEFERVRDLGCDAAQGYRIGRPVPAAAVLPLLSSWGDRDLSVRRRLPGSVRTAVMAVPVGAIPV